MSRECHSAARTRVRCSYMGVTTEYVLILLLFVCVELPQVRMSQTPPGLLSEGLPNVTLFCWVDGDAPEPRIYWTRLDETIDASSLVIARVRLVSKSIKSS